MATKDNTSNTKEYPDKFGRKHDSQEKADGANAQIDAQRKYLKTKYKIRRTPNFRSNSDKCVQGFWIAHLRNNR